MGRQTIRLRHSPFSITPNKLHYDSLLENLKTSGTNQALSEQIHKLSKNGRVKTITSDNGSEFWGHQEIEKRCKIK